MKKILLGLVILFGIPLVSYAHGGGLAADGCHHCWTNCAAKGYTYGTRHCHGGSSSIYTPSYSRSYSTPSYSTTYSCSHLGLLARSNGDGTCSCSTGYSFGKNLLGDTKCISNTEVCQNKYGYSAQYNSLTDSCECGYGEVFQEKSYGSGLECVSCTSKYGYNAEYNSYTEKCQCKDGYTAKDKKYGLGQECVEIENTAYYTLKELDDSNYQAIIESEYNGNSYLITYSWAGCPSYFLDNYLDGRIEVNLGTNLYIEAYDKLVLQNHDQSCSINSVEEVTSDYSFKTNNTNEGTLSREGVQELLDYIQNYSKNIPTTPQCLDTINSSPAADGNCYCHTGYVWNNVLSKCTKEIVVSTKTYTPRATRKKESSYTSTDYQKRRTFSSGGRGYTNPNTPEETTIENETLTDDICREKYGEIAFYRASKNHCQCGIRKCK